MQSVGEIELCLVEAGDPPEVLGTGLPITLPRMKTLPEVALFDV